MKCIMCKVRTINIIAMGIVTGFCIIQGGDKTMCLLQFWLNREVANSLQSGRPGPSIDEEISR